MEIATEQYQAEGKGGSRVAKTVSVAGSEGTLSFRTSRREATN